MNGPQRHTLDDMTDWILLSDAARSVGVSKLTLRRWVQAGRIPGARQLPNGYWVVPAAWVAEFGRVVRRPESE